MNSQKLRLRISASLLYNQIKLLVNNKPRISKDLAACLVAKKHEFIEGGMEKVLDVNKTKQKSTEKLESKKLNMKTSGDETKGRERTWGMAEIGQKDWR